MPLIAKVKYFLTQLEKQIKDIKKEGEERENKFCYLENKLSQKVVDCAFLKGEEPPANEEDDDEADDEDAEINFEEGEFEAGF